MAEDKLDIETLTIDEMLDLKDSLEAKLTEIAKTEATLMAERLTRLKAYMPKEKPAAKRAKSKTTRRKPAKPAPKPEPKAATAPKAEATPKAETAPKPKAASKPKPKTKTTRKAAKPAKVSAKYRDPESGKTWSGRGMAPVWMREAEKAGRKRDEFAI